MKNLALMAGVNMI